MIEGITGPLLAPRPTQRSTNLGIQMFRSIDVPVTQTAEHQPSGERITHAVSATACGEPTTRDGLTSKAVNGVTEVAISFDGAKWRHLSGVFLFRGV